MFSRDLRDATSMAVYYMDSEYREMRQDMLSTKGNKKEIWTKALKIAEENGFLYYLSKRLLENKAGLSKEILRVIVNREREKLQVYRETLKFINCLFEDEGLDLLFIKLYKGIPYIPRDVDILLKREQMGRVISALKRRGVVLKTFGATEILCLKNGLMNIDLYQGFHYLSLPFLDEEFLWHHPRRVDICGLSCPIPSKEADLLSLFIHALLGQRGLSLLDFLYAKSLLTESLNRNDLLEQVDKYRWSYAFCMLSSIVRNIYQSSYLSSSNHKFGGFPLLFSPKFILKALRGFTDFPSVSEKRKLIFIASTLIDNIVHKYFLLQRYTSVQMPNKLKDTLMETICRIRNWSGDHKGIDPI